MTTEQYEVQRAWIAAHPEAVLEIGEYELLF